MKIVIWILTIFVGTAINTLIGEAFGVRAGAVLLYLIEFYVARKLCESWDRNHPQDKGPSA